MTKRIARQMLIRVIVSLLISFAFYAFHNEDAQAAGTETGRTAYETDICVCGAAGTAETAEVESEETAEEAFESYYELFVHGMAEMVETFEKNEI